MWWRKSECKFENLKEVKARKHIAKMGLNGCCWIIKYLVVLVNFLFLVRSVYLIYHYFGEDCNFTRQQIHIWVCCTILFWEGNSLLIVQQTHKVHPTSASSLYCVCFVAAAAFLFLFFSTKQKIKMFPLCSDLFVTWAHAVITIKCHHIDP